MSPSRARNGACITRGPRRISKLNVAASAKTERMGQIIPAQGIPAPIPRSSAPARFRTKNSDRIAIADRKVHRRLLSAHFSGQVRAMFYLPTDLFDLRQTEHLALFEGVEYPWDPLKRLADYIRTHLQPIQHHRTIGQAHIGPNVFIGEGTVVEHGAMILGPAIIGKNCQIRHNAYIRENVIVGDNAVVGNACEVKHSILFNNAQVPHFNYVGDSILGYKAHLGAGAVLSNIKLAPENVWIEMDGRCIDTGLRKIGALVGDQTDIGCNSVLNPGSIIGRGAMVYPNMSWRGILPANMIAKNRAAQEITLRRPRHE